MKKNIFFSCLNFFIFIVLIDFIFGKYFDKSPALKVPFAETNIHRNYNTLQLNELKDDYIINYSRDKNGYRPYYGNGEYLCERKYLSIGGSTTEQMHVDDTNTYQEIIKRISKNNICLINGGIGGHSSYSSTLAVENWHSKLFNDQDIEGIIALIGVNDVFYINQKKEILDFNEYIKSKIMRLRSYFYSRSFWYAKLRIFKNKFIDNIIKRIPDGISTIGYGDSNQFTYKKNSKIFQKIALDTENTHYEEIFLKFLKSLKKHYPSSKIYIFQQQDPKCYFKNTTEFQTKISYKIESKDLINKYCEDLANVYLTQDKVLRENNLSSILVYKMYIEYPISENGFFDGIHTNKKGSRLLGEYIQSKLNL